ncbi:hypothetical protein N7454_001622, partial [Penicillium verhagenii]
LEGPEYCPPRDLSYFSQVNRVCNKAAIPILYRNITLIFRSIEDLHTAWSKKYARRLSAVCVNLTADSEFKPLEAWMLEPWAISQAVDRKPATRKDFLDQLMTSCYLPCGERMFLNRPSRLLQTQDWAAVVLLIASLDRLE